MLAYYRKGLNTQIRKKYFQVCMRQCVHMHMLVGVLSVCVEIRSWLWIYSLPYFYSRQDFSLNLKPAFSARRAGHWVPTHLFLHFRIPALVTGTLLHIQLFLSMLGILNYVCILYSKHFTHWSIVSAQKDWCLFLFFLLFSVGSRGNPEWVNFWVECVLLACIQPRQEIQSFRPMGKWQSLPLWMRLRELAKLFSGQCADYTVYRKCPL